MTRSDSIKTPASGQARARLLSVGEPTRSRHDVALAVALLVLLTFVALISRPLTAVDETRYLAVAWEMWLRGDFLVPFKNGAPYSHKPPLLFWTIHAGWAVFGVNAWWPRLVPPLYSLASLGLLVVLARRLWPDRPAIGGQAALVLVASLLWALYSTAVMFDVMLAFFVLLALVGVFDAAAGQRRGFALVALAVGLGILAKGPAMLLHVLPVALAVGWWRTGEPVWSTGRWLVGLLLAVAGGALIALAWAIPAGIAGGEAYQNAIFWGQTANRMADSFAHQRPVWWYAAMLPVLLFPWLWWPALWRTGYAAAREWRAFDAGTRFCLAWAIPVFVAFSLISGKQQHYLIPIVPAFALLVARGLGQASGAYKGWQQPPGSHAGLGLVAFVLAALGVFLALVATGVLTSKRLPDVPLLWPALALIGLALTLYRQAQRLGGLRALALAGALGFALIQLSASSVFARMYDLQDFSATLRSLQNAGLPVAVDGEYHGQFHFAGRLREPLTELDGEQRHAWLAAHPDGWVVVFLRDDIPPAVTTLRFQAYRGGGLALMDAKNAARWWQGGVGN